jgi:hypothetical protein
MLTTRCRSAKLPLSIDILNLKLAFPQILKNDRISVVMTSELSDDR